MPYISIEDKASIEYKEQDGHIYMISINADSSSPFLVARLVKKAIKEFSRVAEFDKNGKLVFKFVRGKMVSGKLHTPALTKEVREMLQAVLPRVKNDNSA